MDITEIAQIGVHIQSQPVHRYEMAAPYPDGTNLPLVGSTRCKPYTGRPLHPSGFDAIRTAYPDYGFFQHGP